MTAGTTDLAAVLPEILVAAVGILVLVIDAALGRRRAPRALAALTVLGLAGALAVGVLAPTIGVFFSGIVVIDAFTSFFRVVFILLAILGVLVAPGYLRRHDIPAAEYYAIVCFSTLGAMTVALATDLITLFLGLELMAIPVYVLVAMQRRDRFANEAGLKYFLLGAFSSAFLLYGFVWLYGATGTTVLAEIARAVAGGGVGDGPIMVALALITVGLGFKAAVVPFHQWTPDAYDGAPTPTTAFISVAPKAAAFAAILRVMVGGLEALSVDWVTLLAILAVATMTLGNVVALVQRNVKRMLSYSSIAHTGYILAAVAAYGAGEAAIGAVLFYVLAYGVMNLGAFACLLYLDIDGTRGATLEELNGFARRVPGGALAFTIFLISLTGIPLTVGFIAKVLVLQPILDAGLVWLAVAIALNAALAAFYYLRVVVHMYMYEQDADAPALLSERSLSLALGVSAIAVVVVGVLPDRVYAWALEAAVPLLAR